MSEQIVWHTTPPSKILAALGSSDKGLSQSEANKIYKKAGPNKLPTQPPTGWIIILLRQLRSPLVYILILAALASAFLQDFTDVVMILLALTINSVFGFVQEYRADRALNALQKISTATAIALRDRQWQSIPTENLVPGDIVRLRAGDRLPADVRLLKVNNLHVNESALTGESEPVIKIETKTLAPTIVLAERTNMAYLGTSIMLGNGVGIVVDSGARTELGRIATSIITTTRRPSPLQHRIDQFARWLTVAFALTTFLVIIIGWWRGNDPIETVKIAVALAVAAIPEGLVIAVTAILTIGMQRILANHGLIRRLTATETLGSTTVIGVDKTGTLTEGKMRVAATKTASLELEHPHTKKSDINYAELEKLLHVALLCNNATVVNPKEALEHIKMLGSATEQALLYLGLTLGVDLDGYNQQFPRLHELPFNERDKFMAVIVENKTAKEILLKGAPEVVLSKCSEVIVNNTVKTLTSNQRHALEREYEQLSQQGLRVLAFAFQKTTRTTIDKPNNQFVFIGFVGIKDPLRPQAAAAILECQRAGIIVKMLTGDHKLTAAAIGRELGLITGPNQVVDATTLAQTPPAKLGQLVERTHIFARVSPHEKLLIIQALQQRHHVVAMTGDGINDAPALKTANIGIALGSGTDVAKEAADLVLLDNNFTTIVRAVEQGRIIFDNIRKVIIYLLSDSLMQIGIIVAAIISGMATPLTAAQILWINLVTDGLPAIGLTWEVGEKNIMSRGTGRRKNIVDFELLTLIGINTIVIGGAAIALYNWLAVRIDELALLQTTMFCAVGVSTLFLTYSCRHLRSSLFTSNPFRNRALNLSIIGSLMLQLVAVYLPAAQQLLNTTALPAHYWVIVIGFAIITTTLIELVKSIFNFVHKHQRSHV